MNPLNDEFTTNGELVLSYELAPNIESLRI